ncbi:hypothetical protein VB715_20340 [Crocosphaera sp. UHCC 0190]|uniref:hypothetical protein n=1 Tax=Crocosphaera sp. UHCC 0190 TaxID=3110246 RepID=UPI002B1F2924|nr:hypothetical protein [Crocosphaera sp. UHCC 0190]MEA5512127.1 hypothetical protein [Crocosphaera sp. UHCC 0190]
MSSFQEFMDKAEESPTTDLPGSNVSLSSIETSLKSVVSDLLTPFSVRVDKKQEFAEKVSNLVRDKEFISEFSDRIGEPSELETEDEFVERGSNVLRKMLYDKFGIKD